MANKKKDIDDLLLYQPTDADMAMFNFYKENPAFAAKKILNQDLAPFQQVCVNGVQKRSYVLSVLARGSGKTRMIAINAALLALFTPKMRVGFFAPTFRQSKLAFAEFEALVGESPHLEASIKRISKQTDMFSCEFWNGAFIFALPLAADNPASIRGVRVHAAMIDEYPHVKKETLDLVINPMLATQRNPMVQVRRIEEEKRLIAEGIEFQPAKPNKNKICGFSSAYYQFNHMFQTIDKYKGFIERDKLKGVASDYGVYIFNYHDAPEGFFDAKMIQHAKETSSEIAFRMEYESEFPSDSDGFFKRSLIDACRADFNLELKGEKGARYFIGADPARKDDNFSITIIKQVGETMQLVGIYSFHQTAFHVVAEFIRHLCRIFNVETLGIDAGGGGEPFKDALANPTTAGDVKDILLDMEDDATVGKQGRRIIRMINFTSSWITEANYDMRASMEHKKFLFPDLDEGSTYIKPEADMGDDIDTMNVEYFALINELQAIIMTATKNGTLHFDTQQQSQRKDRYSSLLVCHRIASDFFRQGFQKKELAVGGWSDSQGKIMTPNDKNQEMWGGETRIIDEIRAAQRAHLASPGAGALIEED